MIIYCIVCLIIFLIVSLIGFAYIRIGELDYSLEAHGICLLVSFFPLANVLLLVIALNVFLDEFNVCSNFDKFVTQLIRSGKNPPQEMCAGDCCKESES